MTVALIVAMIVAAYLYVANCYLQSELDHLKGELPKRGKNGRFAKKKTECADDTSGRLGDF